MTFSTAFARTLPRKSRLAALRDHFAVVEDPRDLRRILHPLLVVCASICPARMAWRAR